MPVCVRCRDAPSGGGAVGAASPTAAARSAGSAADRRPDGAAALRRLVAGQSGEAEVEHLDVVAVGDEEVGRLDVAVNDAAAVGGVERLGDLPREVDDPRRRHRPVLDQLTHRDALEPLHDDERLALVLAELVDRTDVRMLQRRGEPRLTAEPAQPLGRGGGIGVQRS